MPNIETISYEEARGTLKEAYDHIIESRGKLAEVHKIQSLNPEALLAHMKLYMVTMFGKSPLRRYQREMLGVIVSAANRCSYCINHHEQALLVYWKDSEKTRHLINDRTLLSLSKEDKLLCKLAESLTRNEQQDYTKEIDLLNDTGIDDRAILDAVQIISYFNFVNRMVLALGVEYDEHEMKGYNY
ncbi:MAG: peroxidase-related enzyme [Bacteroidota bacterium]